MKTILRSLLLLTSLALAPILSAQITITYTATPVAEGNGYLASTSYTFSFTLGASFEEANLYDQVFGADIALWEQQNTASLDTGHIFSTWSGTGFNGTYAVVTPTASNKESAYIWVQPSVARLEVDAYNPDGYSLKALDGTTNITGFWARDLVFATGPNFSGLTTGYVNPGAYFSAYLGNYVTTSGNFALQIPGGLNPGYINFTVDSLTISSSAVPEPSTYAAIFGTIVLLGTIAIRKRAKRPTVQ